MQEKLEKIVVQICNLLNYSVHAIFLHFPNLGVKSFCRDIPCATSAIKRLLI